MQPQLSPTSSLPRLSFRARIANKQSTIVTEHDRVIAWASGYGYRDKNLWAKNGKKRIGVVPILPEYLSEDDIQFVDPRSGFDTTFEADPLPDILTTVDPGPIKTILLGPLPTPTSRKALHQNLLSLMSQPDRPVRLRALISYHSHPQYCTFHSARSFNLLISLAIRLASFKTAQRLLSQMRAESIVGNLETWKLGVRLMVRRGEWDRAWESVMRILKMEGWQEKMGVPIQNVDGMPLAIWLEFMSTMKRGAIPKWSALGKHWLGKPGATPKEREPKGEEDEGVWKSEPFEKTAADLKSLNAQRLRLLMSHTPSLTPQERNRIPARAVYITVCMMLRAGHLEDARDMTMSYMAGLPPKLDPGTIQSSRDIIHLHIPWLFTENSPLHRYYDVRKTVESFFTVHRDITPDAKTLFLLLRSLRRATNSGTLARQAATAFRRKWGYHTESRLVRQRITAFAIRERNVDLAEAELRKEMQTRFQDMTYAVQAEVLGRTRFMGYLRLLRRPVRKVYNEGGVDFMRWRYLARQIKRIKATKAQKKSRG